MPPGSKAKAKTRKAREPRTLLKGCQHSLLGATQTGIVEPTVPMEITVLLRRRTLLPSLRSAARSPGRKHLTHAQFFRQYGATAADVAKLRAFAARHDLVITHHAPQHRTMVLAGPAQAIAHAFAIDFATFSHPDGEFFAPARTPSIPRELHGIVEAILGLHNWRCKSRRYRAAAANDRTRSMLALAEDYAFPASADGTGQTIALIELGGGFYPADIEAFCAKIGIPTPRITSVEVRGIPNRPAPADDVRKLINFVNGTGKLSPAEQASPAIEAAQCTVEVTMDIEILAALAPGAHIVVYFSTPDEQGIFHAVSQAIQDTTHSPGILSISWGEPEPSLSDAYIRALDQAFLAASHLGITILASSGDDGARNNSPDKLPAVNFPASSPHCIACGGTTPGPKGRRGREEVVWNSSYHGNKGATGGGISRQFPLPAWQRNANVPIAPTGKCGRGVPDVAGPADPRYGSEILIAGGTCAAAGTSAVVPMWAALIARCNQALGMRCGYLNPALYRIARNGTSAFQPVTKGNNNGYNAGQGWNACAGNGIPHGESLLRALRHEFTRRP